MGLTTERKVFFGLAAVAGLALFIDQGIMGPKEASADLVSLTADTISEGVVIGGVEAPTMRPAAAILMERLSKSDSTTMAGSLGSSFSMTTMIEPVASPSDNQSASDEQFDTESFPIIAPSARDLPVLSSVMPARNGGAAVLGGTLLRVGQVDSSGYRLVLVHARSVLVERDGVQYAIEIPTTSGDS